MVKNPPADERDMSLIPESGKYCGDGNVNRSRILAWEIPWTKEPGRLHSMGSQESWT